MQIGGVLRAGDSVRGAELVSLGVTIPIVDGEFLMANDYFNLREHPITAFSTVTSWPA